MQGEGRRNGRIGGGEGERFRGDVYDDEGRKSGKEGMKKNDGVATQSAGRREFGGGGGDMGEVQRPAGQQAVGMGRLWNRFKYGSEEQK